ncbi:hypothetical protein HK100_003762 [Physocladia obscura]|uniref:J domain-containing protein n=1 Tax=Physocladia obscura TaxID=109957 RepID=A0AAD5X969_9FUNG|nr:hypothetical protein HK100_003762 [Physocladia obscura]
MRVSFPSGLLVLLCACLVLAWDKEDYAIFDLHDKLIKIKGEKDETGNKINFYNILQIPTSATPIQLSRAYKKASLELHPDKNPDPKSAALYALLTSINGVLKDKELRERYDGHLKKGIPTWRGTGYFIARYKPSFTFILTFVALAISATQYIIQYVQYSQASTKLEALLAEQAATDSNDNLGYKNLRNMLEKVGHPESAAIKKAISSGVAVAQILKMPELDGVFTDEDRAQELAAEANESRGQLDVIKPSIKKTLLVQGPEFLYNLPAKITAFRKTFAEAYEVASKKASNTTKKGSSNDGVDGDDSDVDAKPKKQSIAKLMKEARTKPKEFEKKLDVAKKQKAAAEGDEAAKAELAELEAVAAADKPKKKTVVKEVLKSKSGITISKADFIKQKKEELARAEEAARVEAIAAAAKAKAAEEFVKANSADE